jgi:hypothetical protein
MAISFLTSLFKAFWELSKTKVTSAASAFGRLSEPWKMTSSLDLPRSVL